MVRQLKDYERISLVSSWLSSTKSRWWVRGLSLKFTNGCAVHGECRGKTSAVWWFQCDLRWRHVSVATGSRRRAVRRQRICARRECRAFGLLLWERSVNSYHELTENMRLRTASLENRWFAKFCSSARLGKFDKRGGALLNSRRAVGRNDRDRILGAIRRAGPEAVCIAGRNQVVKEVNEYCYDPC